MSEAPDEVPEIRQLDSRLFVSTAMLAPQFDRASRSWPFLGPAADVGVAVTPSTARAT